MLSAFIILLILTAILDYFEEYKISGGIKKFLNSDFVQKKVFGNKWAVKILNIKWVKKILNNKIFLRIKNLINK